MDQEGDGHSEEIIMLMRYGAQGKYDLRNKRRGDTIVEF